MAQSNKRDSKSEDKDKHIQIKLLEFILEAEKTKSGIKVKSAYLTKNKAAMKREIDRVKKLKSDDPSAYGKWEADYSDKDKTKKYKTKKSAATTAYEKKFGKKND